MYSCTVVWVVLWGICCYWVGAYISDGLMYPSISQTIFKNLLLSALGVVVSILMPVIVARFFLKCDTVALNLIKKWFQRF